MQRKAVHAGTAGASEGRSFAFIAKPRANAADLLTGALAKGNTLLNVQVILPEYVANPQHLHAL
jgi:hypothetical protein